MTRTILFLMSDTGGGHRAACEAIAEAVHHLYPGQFRTIIEDIWTHRTPWPINRLPKTYPWLTGPGLPVWKAMWACSSRLPLHRLVPPLLAPLLANRMVAFLAQVRPDVVVSAHPLMNHLTIRWLRRAGMTCPLVTVITDMVAVHPLWVCPDVSLCLTPTDEARQTALHYGLPPDRVVVCGQPVRLGFSRPAADRETLRQRLGFQAGKPLVLLVGGGEGFGPLDKIARGLNRCTGIQMAVVCGRNQALKARLDAARWDIPVRIFGFVHNMPELMTAADLLVTKAGPGMLAEAFIAGTPVLIYGFIPGQETDNVHYVLRHRAGLYVDTPEAIAAQVQALFRPGNPTLAEMAGNAARLARPNAALEIARQICALAPPVPAEGDDVLRRLQRGMRSRLRSFARRVAVR